jgi:hypothetical protein
MFNLLISADATAWETDQLMRMDADHFKEYSDGTEAELIALENNVLDGFHQVVGEFRAGAVIVEQSSAWTETYARMDDRLGVATR